MRSLLLVTFLFAACATEDDADELVLDDDFEIEDEPVDTAVPFAGKDMFAGVNSDWCIASPFNCRFREPGISQRVLTASGLESWGVEPGASLRDGHGDPLIKVTKDRLTFNFGQTRSLAGKAHALAMSSNNNSAGWYPIDRVLGEASFRARVGEVNARDPKRQKMACYEIRDAHTASIELLKVVHDSTAEHERMGDYQPLVRANGRRSVNLIFMVPGFGLGGATIDHFPAGTKFQRVSVPTSSGKPSITIPLWGKDGDGRYRKRTGSMRFMYGYVRADGVRRFGWMAQDALTPATGC
jgi:hypothetical protein